MLQDLPVPRFLTGGNWASGWPFFLDPILLNPATSVGSSVFHGALPSPQWRKTIASASATLSPKAGSLPFFSEEPGLRGCMVVKCLLSLKVALLLNQNSGLATDHSNSPSSDSPDRDLFPGFPDILQKHIFPLSSRSVMIGRKKREFGNKMSLKIQLGSWASTIAAFYFLCTTQES